MEWFSSTDAAQLAKLPFSAAMAACVPVRHWDRVADLAVRAGASVTRRPVKDTVSRLLRHLDPSDLDEPVDAVACRCLRNIHIDRLATLRSHDPRGWRIIAEVEGLDHIRASWTARGVILWVAPFAFGGLVTKRAMHEAGIPVHHLSTSTHGSSSRSRFGVACLRMIRVKVENRYLAERVVIPPDGSLFQPLRRLSALLGQGAVVSVTIGSMGSQLATVPFLRGELQVATGVPSLALRTGADILPVATVRTGSVAFVTSIGPPIVIDRRAGASAARSQIVRELAARLEPFARQWPDQVRWDHGLFGPAAAGAEAWA